MTLYGVRKESHRPRHKAQEASVWRFLALDERWSFRNFFGPPISEHLVGISRMLQSNKVSNPIISFALFGYIWPNSQSSLLVFDSFCVGWLGFPMCPSTTLGFSHFWRSPLIYFYWGHTLLIVLLRCKPRDPSWGEFHSASYEKKRPNYHMHKTCTVFSAFLFVLFRYLSFSILG